MKKESSKIKKLFVIPFLFGVTGLFAQQIDVEENKSEVLSNGKVVKKYNDKKLEASNTAARKGEFDGNTLQFVYTKEGISLYNDQEGKIRHVNWKAEDYKFKKKK